LIEEILTSLGLSEQTVDWRNSSDAQEAAIDFVKRATAYKNGMSNLMQPAPMSR
jgi:hypothetical protein